MIAERELVTVGKNSVRVMTNRAGLLGKFIELYYETREEVFDTCSVHSSSNLSVETKQENKPSGTTSFAITHAGVTTNA